MPVVLSVIIPSRNGSKYLDSLIELCSKSNSPEVEFVVVDNSDIPYKMPSNSDQRMKLIRDGKIRSMSDNWDFGASVAIGDWKCFIGDDDGLLPGEFDCFVEGLKSTKADVVVGGFSHFFWPGSSDYVSKSDLEFGRVTTWIDRYPKRASRRLTGNPLKDFENIRFPMPYARGVFHKNLEFKIRAQNAGRLFSASSPDLNLGAALQLNSAQLEISDCSPFIVGTSPKSNGLAFLTNSSSALSKDFSSKNSHPWLPELGTTQPPLSYLSYLEPLVQASKSKTGLTDLPDPFAIIAKSLFTSTKRQPLEEVLRTIYPSLKWYVALISLFSSIVSPMVRGLGLARFALRRLMLSQSTLVVASGESLLSIVEAAELIEELRQGRNGPSLCRAQVNQRVFKLFKRATTKSLENPQRSSAE